MNNPALYSDMWSWFAGVADWRSVAVLKRNARVYLTNWKTAFFPPAMEPIAYLIIFGVGLGGFVEGIPYEGRNIGYGSYIAPGLLAYSAFTTPYYECLYSSYVRMLYQKTWDGILATQVELPNVVWGEILWAGTRGFMNTAIVAVVIVVCRALGIVDVELQWLWAALPLVFMVGWLFGAFGLIFTASIPSIDHMNYPVFLIGFPLSLTSNTFFPLPEKHPWLHWVVEVNPIAQLAETFRGLLLGGPWTDHAWKLIALWLPMCAVCVLAAQYLTRRRLLGA